MPCSGAIYLGIVAVLNASGGGPTGLALLALYNLAYIAPLVGLLLVVSDRRTLGRLGRWNGANSPWVKAGLALAVVAMSFGLLVHALTRRAWQGHPELRVRRRRVEYSQGVSTTTT